MSYHKLTLYKAVVQRKVPHLSGLTFGAEEAITVN